jgi:hypothetical protein
MCAGNFVDARTRLGSHVTFWLELHVQVLNQMIISAQILVSTTRAGAQLND